MGSRAARLQTAPSTRRCPLGSARRTQASSHGGGSIRPAPQPRASPTPSRARERMIPSAQQHQHSLNHLSPPRCKYRCQQRLRDSAGMQRTRLQRQQQSRYQNWFVAEVFATRGCACCINVTRAMSGAGPESRPTRKPALSTLLKESVRMTRPSTSRDRKDGMRKELQVYTGQ